MKQRKVAPSYWLSKGWPIGMKEKCKYYYGNLHFIPNSRGMYFLLQEYE
jgi:hypothetical protein